MRKENAKKVVIIGAMVATVFAIGMSTKASLISNASGYDIFTFSLPSSIRSNGLIRVSYEDDTPDSVIDSDDIYNNRAALREADTQLGGSDKLFFYEVDGHIYMVTGLHTRLTGITDFNKAEAIIKAEKNGDGSVIYNGETINLTDGGNATWQRVL